MRTIAAALLCALPSGAFACDDLPGLLRAAYPGAAATADSFTVDGTYRQRIAVQDVQCRIWPYKPDITLLAVPLIEADPASPDEARGDVEILVLDSRSGNPLARRRETGMAYGDAVTFSGVALDTARYDIRPGERAFGIVTGQGGSSRVNPYSESALWLYRFADGRIERVLDGLVTRRFNGENDGNCVGEAREIKRTLSVSKSAAGGYRDLAVDQTEVNSRTVDTGGDCVSTDKAGASRRFTLKFESGRYRAVDATQEDDLFSSIEIAGAK